MSDQSSSIGMSLCPYCQWMYPIEHQERCKGTPRKQEAAPDPRDGEIADLRKQLDEALHTINEQRLNLYQVLPNSVLPPLDSDYHTLICAVGRLAHDNTIQPRIDLAAYRAAEKES